MINKGFHKILLGLLVVCFAGVAFAGGGGESGLTHRMMVLVIQLGVILFAARIGNKLFEKLHLPGVLGELCAGILIGPYALGTLGLPLPGFEEGLFAIHSFVDASVGVSPELYGLCTVASIVLLFLVGVETDLEMFLRYSAVGSLVGIGGVAISFVAGMGAGMFFLGHPWDHPACIFLGVMSTATSVSITARILSERRKLDSQEGVTILAGAVIDDVLGIILLAIGMSLINAKALGNEVAWSSIGWIAVKTFGIWAGATALGIMLSRTIAKALKPLGSHSEVAILALGLALILGGLFEEANLAMIIGAYVMGLAFSRTEINFMVQEKLHSVYIFLVPVFFAVMGMMVDVTQLFKPQILLFGLVYTAVAVLSKLVGCGLPAFFFGANARGALRIGLGMVPRGEVALIIAGIARSSGMLGPDGNEVFSVAVMMTLITTLVAPPLLVRAFKGDASGLRKRYRTQEAKRPPTAVYTFPNCEVANLVLSKIIQNLSKEGFFTNTISANEGLMQARKEDLVITIIAKDSTISFDAAESASSFVRVVVAESLAEFEEILTELRKPIGGNATGLSLSDKQDRPQNHRSTVLSRHLREDCLTPNLKGSTVEEVVRELIDVLVSTRMVQDVDATLEYVMRRENLMSTGVGHGVACPHTRTGTVSNVVCAVGISEKGIDFGNVDGTPCHIVMLTLSPITGSSPYMTFMSAALSCLKHEETRSKLRAASTSHAIRNAFLKSK